MCGNQRIAITLTTLVTGYLAEPLIGHLVLPALTATGLDESAAAAGAVIVALVLATGLSVVLGEMVPKNLALARPLATAVAVTAAQPASKKKLSFKETREFELMEKTIHEAEAKLQQKLSALNDPDVTGDATRLHAASVELEQAQKTVEKLYARWAELEGKLT